MVQIFWSDEDDGYVAVDVTRPGCSAVGETEKGALLQLDLARMAWDEAKEALTKEIQQNNQ